MSHDIYQRALLEGALALGIRIDLELAQKMSLHHGLVVRWGSRINLTKIVDPIQAAHLHGLDSLLIAELIEPELALRTADIGSGAGFPGIVVALARPRLAMTLLEPIRKRASFLRVALAELGRPDVAVVEARLGGDPNGHPTGDPSASRWPVDLILSRATIPPLELIPLADPFLGPTGKIILTSGASAPDPDTLESVAARIGLRHAGRRHFTLPGGVTRVLDVVVRKEVRKEAG